MYFVYYYFKYFNQKEIEIRVFVLRLTFAIKYLIGFKGRINLWETLFDQNGSLYWANLGFWKWYSWFISVGTAHESRIIKHFVYLLFHSLPGLLFTFWNCSIPSQVYCLPVELFHSHPGLLFTCWNFSIPSLVYCFLLELFRSFPDLLFTHWNCSILSQVQNLPVGVVSFPPRFTA